MEIEVNIKKKLDSTKPTTNKKKNIKKNSPKKKNNKKKNKKKVKKNKNIGVIIAISILCVIAALILFINIFKRLNIFNITKISVINNYKISSEEIIEKSNLTVGNSMFETLKTTSINNIKTNPYIEDVNIKRKFNGEIIIDVTERTATYMLQRENDYIYINNQGYILEVSQSPLELPIIKGFSTTEFNTGNRINIQDLEKLDIIIKMMESAKSNQIKDIIKTIDISDENNFILEIPSEGKTVQFGNEKNINVKILWIVDMVTREKGVEGEIILNVPDIKKVYFREKV